MKVEKPHSDKIQFVTEVLEDGEKTALWRNAIRDWFKSTKTVLN